MSVVEPILKAAYQRESLREWHRGRGRAPSSFYISNFPGDDPIACGRARVYSLMDVPDDKPFDPEALARMEAGKALETTWIRKFAAEGVLLTGNEAEGDKQTKFEDPTSWASGAVDAIILPYGWRKGHCVEVKNTAHLKVEAMRADPEQTMWSHPKYVKQLKTYIAFAHEQQWAPRVVVCKESWAITTEFPMGMRWCPIHETFECETLDIQLDPPDDGTLIFSSRDEPLLTASYYFTYDPEFLAAGRAKLAEWRGYYERGELPPHPHEGQRSKWTPEPCKWCGFKRNVCKPDYVGGVKSMSESHALEFSASVRDSYDYPSARAQVFARWGLSDPLEAAA